MVGEMGKGGKSDKKKKELEFPVEGQNPDGQMASPGSCSAHTTWVCQPPNCSTHV